jgi:hypothetical protein
MRSNPTGRYLEHYRLLVTIVPFTSGGWGRVFDAPVVVLGGIRSAPAPATRRPCRIAMR